MEILKCRLCTASEDLIEIFSQEGERRSIATKINECLPVVVQKDDKLPKYICSECCRKVEEFYEFSRACEEAGLAFEATLDDQSHLCLELQEGTLAEKLFDHNRNNDETKTIKSRKKVERSPACEEKIAECNSSDDQYEVNGPMAIGNENEGKKLNMNNSLLNFGPLFNIGQPGEDDYVLVKEETFDLCNENINREITEEDESEYVEFFQSSNKPDNDIIETQRKRKDILPQMWDVFIKNSLNSRENKTTVVHRRYIISKGAFSCSLCGQCYSIAEGFPREMDSSSSGLDTSENNGSNLDFRMFSCTQCGKVFPRRSSLKRHIQLHGNYKPFSCTLCGRAFNRKEHLSRHMVSHTGGRPFHCDICFKPFTRKEHLMRHRNITHFADQRILVTGNKSESVNSSESPVVKEEVKDYDPENPIPCEICGEVFSQKQYLINHQRTIHSIHWEVIESTPKDLLLRPYNCVVCNKKFTRKEHLVRHHKIHERQFGKLQRGEMSLSVISQKN